MDKEDITVNTIEKFKQEIAKAKTIVLAGVLGKYEDEGHSQGTKAIFDAVGKHLRLLKLSGEETVWLQLQNITFKKNLIGFQLVAEQCLSF